MAQSSENFITPGHIRAFQLVTSRVFEDNITLWSCRINGEPGVAIVAVDHPAPSKLAIMPLFVALTESMDVTFEGVEGGSGGGGGGGPKDPREAFEVNKEMTSPAPV